jgi:hypothetical protein
MAKLHMDSIARKLSRKSVRRTLEELPHGLDAIYDDAMHRIESQTPECVEIAKKVLCWVAFSLRPLSIPELQHALVIEPGLCELEHDDFPDDEMMISACAGLVVVETKTNMVRLVRKLCYSGLALFYQ